MGKNALIVQLNAAALKHHTHRDTLQNVSAPPWRQVSGRKKGRKKITALISLKYLNSIK